MPVSIPATPPPAPTTTETPFFFTSADRPVYGVFHAARRERRDAPAVVLCSSIGLEQLTSYRNEVLAARALADLGLPVLRYHPRGQGDSAGDFADVTLATLAEDARAAAREMKERAGTGRLAWLGVRFGALAAGSAAQPGEPIALWEPVQEPLAYFRAWLRGILFSSVSHGERPTTTVDELLATVERDGMLDVHGYGFHRALLESSRGTTLAAVTGAWTGQALLVQVQQRRALAPAHEQFTAALRERGATVTTALLNEEPGWHIVQNPQWLSSELVRTTAEWFDAVA